ncbi:MAG TPA: SGNH/GDSL hydrolase family protein [Bacteroidales bacterium]|nr:hydrolase [Bacteroidales bacterium]HNR41573.1 SGNH/GDSL hydrolase family protein [Bacteroidales bacterium]HPM18018.1 SGNH/GDSL hydrolase family protein [Bacteroidales bacterium]
MKQLIIAAVMMITGLSVHGRDQETKNGNNIRFYDQNHFLIEGIAFADSVRESPYDRFPLSMKSKVREPVWSLSRNSAGVSIRFISNTTAIRVKWELLEDLRMNHMAETGIKGIDLYFMGKAGWQYVNTARPEGKSNDFLLISNMIPERREYRMYLPLYDGVTRIEVGIDSLAYISKPEKQKVRPIVFYGTSITQGGCASRPGMVHTSIISRKLGIECMNFGFSGNGRMEKPVVDLIAGIDALFYVIECSENMTPEEIKANSGPLLEIIRQKHPITPVLFVNNANYEISSLSESAMKYIIAKNKMFREVFMDLIEAGNKNIYLIDKEKSLGHDHEATVDGEHLTDLGFMRYAEFLLGRFRELGLPAE